MATIRPYGQVDVDDALQAISSANGIALDDDVREFARD